MRLWYDEEISRLEEEVKRLKKENQRLQDRLTDYGWQADAWREVYERERRQDGW